jgi:hypothetical protein
MQEIKNFAINNHERVSQEINDHKIVALQVRNRLLNTEAKTLALEQTCKQLQTQLTGTILKHIGSYAEDPIVKIWG